MHDMRAFFRANPQVLVLVIVCLVLGLGTFLAVVFGLLTAGSSRTTGGTLRATASPRRASAGECSCGRAIGRARAGR
jgi:hypothetical protein